MNLPRYMMLSFSLLIINLSCSDFLETDLPKDQLDQVKVFNDVATAEAAMNNVYVMLVEGGFLNGNTADNPFLMACYTDELEVVSTQNTDPRKFYGAVILADNTAVKRLWDTTYKQIYTTNNIIEGVESSPNLSEATKNKLIGEAIAIRGMLHFYLTQTFEDVPYIKTTNYNLNKSIAKQSTNEVMNLAIADLKEAELLLNDEVANTERIRINKPVVQAFLARMYLYQKKWTESLQYANLVINNPLFELEPIETLFLKESKSAIWQLKPTIVGFNTYEAMSYIFTANPAPIAQLTQSLLNDFEVGDLRKTQWVKFVGDTGTNAHAFKYKQRGFSTPTKEYSIVIRIEEMYLIAAEAEAKLGNWPNFNDYLNAIRTRANIPALNITDSNLAENAILNERRIEFFCEFGHRFYDLKRTNKLMSLSAVKPNWMDYFKNLPIPQTEILLNGNLKPQNTGY